MLILSWDVGIKNLAYCISKYNEGKYEIKEWGIINLLKDEMDAQKKCNECKKLAKFKTKNKEYHFCHFNSSLESFSNWLNPPYPHIFLSAF